MSDRLPSYRDYFSPRSYLDVTIVGPGAAWTPWPAATRPGADPRPHTYIPLLRGWWTRRARSPSRFCCSWWGGLSCRVQSGSLLRRRLLRLLLLLASFVSSSCPPPGLVLWLQARVRKKEKANPRRPPTSSAAILVTRAFHHFGYINV